MAVDYSKNYSCRFLVRRLDPRSWQAGDVAYPLRTLTITRNCTESIPLLETLSATADLEVGSEFSEGWYRVEAVVTQESRVSEYEKVDLGTFLMWSNTGTVAFGKDTATIQGKSVLQTCQELKLKKGGYTPLKSDGAELVAKWLSQSTPAPVSVDGKFTIDDYVTFAPGDTYLSAIWSVLDKASWVLMLDGDGTVHVTEKPDKPSFSFTAANRRYIRTNIQYDRGRGSIPNRYYVTDGIETAIASNTNAFSKTSYSARGRWIDVYDDSPMLKDGESLSTYAARMLRDGSKAAETRTYVREFIPGVVPFSLLYFDLPLDGITGEFRVLSQTISCNNGIAVQEQVAKEVALW